MLIHKEMKRSSGLKKFVSNNLSFMTNLSNIKQGLKQDYSDKEILDLILVNTQFTDALIKDHLRVTQQPSPKDMQYAPRDAQSYRQFAMNTYASKD
jgi:hypothetical protein